MEEIIDKNMHSADNNHSDVSDNHDEKRSVPSESKDFQIDLFALVGIIKQNFKFMGVVGIIMMVISAIYVYSIPRTYESTVVLAPEYSGSSSLAGNIGSIASMVGINLGSGSGEDAIYPEVYPDIISSTNFQVGLFDVKVKTFDGKVNCTLYDYFTKECKSPWWSPIIKSITKSLKRKSNISPINTGDGKPNPEWLTYDQTMFCKILDASIQCAVDKKTSLITLTFWSQDPYVSMTMADSVKVKLQDFIIDYRTKKARIDLQYFESLLADASKEYQKAQTNYAAYCDSHHSSIFQSDISERDHLENELSIATNIYNQLLQQVQVVKAKIQEKTPSFTVIKNATVPIRPSKPKRLITMLVFFVLGFIGAGVYKYVRNTIKF